MIHKILEKFIVLYRPLKTCLILEQKTRRIRQNRLACTYQRDLLDRHRTVQMAILSPRIAQPMNTSRMTNAIMPASIKSTIAPAMMPKIWPATPAPIKLTRAPIIGPMPKSPELKPNPRGLTTPGTLQRSAPSTFVHDFVRQGMCLGCCWCLIAKHIPLLVVIEINRTRPPRFLCRWLILAEFALETAAQIFTVSFAQTNKEANVFSRVREKSHGNKS